MDFSFVSRAGLILPVFGRLRHKFLDAAPCSDFFELAELSIELALCPPVFLTKPRTGVDLTKVVGAPAGEAFESARCHSHFTSLQLSRRIRV